MREQAMEEPTGRQVEFGLCGGVQWVAVGCGGLQWVSQKSTVYSCFLVSLGGSGLWRMTCKMGVLQCGAVHCSVLQRVQCIVACCSVLQRVAFRRMSCNLGVLQRVAIHCSVLQCDAMRCTLANVSQL